MSETDKFIVPIRTLGEWEKDGLKYRVRLIAAFDDKVPKRYGICAARLEFSLARGNLAVSWLFFTDWYLEETKQRLDGSINRPRLPYGLGDVNMHSPVPVYVGQDSYSSDCEFTGGKCYGDGSSLESMALFKRVVRGDEGEPWVTLQSWMSDLEKKVSEQKTMERNFS